MQGWRWHRGLPSMSAGSLLRGEQGARWGGLAPPATWLLRGCSFCKQHGKQGACWHALWGDAPHAQAEPNDSHKLGGFLTHCFIAACKHLPVVSQTARPQRCSAGLAMETRSPRSSHHAASRDHPCHSLSAGTDTAWHPACSTCCEDRERLLIHSLSARAEGQCWPQTGSTGHTPHPHIPREAQPRLTQAELCGELPLGSSSLTISRLLWCTATCSGVRPFCRGRERVQTGETEPLPVLDHSFHTNNTHLPCCIGVSVMCQQQLCHIHLSVLGCNVERGKSFLRRKAAHHRVAEMKRLLVPAVTQEEAAPPATGTLCHQPAQPCPSWVMPSTAVDSAAHLGHAGL